MGIGITKGNWQIVRKGNTVQSLSIMSENVDKICHGISPRHIADAKLIAAAPDLLEALQEIVCSGTGYIVNDQDLKKAKNALEKALK